MVRLFKLLGVSILLSALNAAATVENDVSPELARKAAFWVSEGFRSTGGNPATVSEPKVYYNYAGTLRYYVFYIYRGPDKMPSWGEIEKDPSAASLSKGTFRNVEITGTRSISPFFSVNSGVPRVVSSINRAKERLEESRPGCDWEFCRAFIECLDVYYIFHSGPSEIVVNPVGEVVDVNDVQISLDLLDTKERESRALSVWAEIELYQITESRLDD